MNRRALLVTVIVLVSVLLFSGFLWWRTQEATAPASDQNQEQQVGQPEEPVPAEPVVPTFDKQQYSLTDPTSPWVIVNKQRPLPNGYTPANLTTPDIGGGQLKAEASDALDRMFAAARADGINLELVSGFRSESRQRTIYNNYVARDGQAAADRYSARPGHSEHQTGWVADVGNTSGTCELETCFGDTAGGQWVAANAHKYGFVVRYLEGKEPVTGYQYEPWHLRYVGTDLAKEIHGTNQTLEEFFSLPPAPSY